MAEMHNLEEERRKRKPEEVEPPNNVETEQQVLGALLVQPSLYSSVADILTADDFFHSLHADIFEAIGRSHERGVSPGYYTIIADAVKEHPHWADLGAKPGAYLAEIMGEVVATSHTEGLARAVKELAARRNMLDGMQGAADLLYGGFATSNEEAGAVLRGALDAFEAEGGSLARTISDGFEETLEGIEERYKNPEQAMIGTGFPSLDEVIGGLYPGQVIYLGGATSAGKTSFAQAICWNIASQGRGVAVFSMEMPRAEYIVRHIAQISGVPVPRIKNSRFSEDEFRAISAARETFAGLKSFWIDDQSRLTVRQISARVRKLQERGKLDFVLIDHLGFIVAEDPKAMQHERIEEVTQGLKALAKEFEIAVLVVSKLNREHVKRDNQKPRLSDFYGSSAIEYDADLVLALYREAYHLGQQEPVHETEEWYAWQGKMNDVRTDAEVLVLKNRQGGTKPIKLHFDASLTLFSDKTIDKTEGNNLL